MIEVLIYLKRKLSIIQLSILKLYHFPKFLNHQECDYLIEQANIALEITQLKIIVKVMKEKNEKSSVEKKYEYFNRMANAAQRVKHHRKNLLQEELENLIDIQKDI